MNTIHMTKVIVTRASQTHQTPQALRAQSGPVTRTMVPNSTTSDAAACAR
jgi:hypothetical protein